MAHEGIFLCAMISTQILIEEVEVVQTLENLEIVTYYSGNCCYLDFKSSFTYLFM